MYAYKLTDLAKIETALSRIKLYQPNWQACKSYKDVRCKSAGSNQLQKLKTTAQVSIGRDKRMSQSIKKKANLAVFKIEFKKIFLVLTREEKLIL